MRRPISRPQARSYRYWRHPAARAYNRNREFLTALIQFRPNGAQLSVYTEPFGEIEFYERFSSD